MKRFILFCFVALVLSFIAPQVDASPPDLPQDGCQIEMAQSVPCMEVATNEDFAPVLNNCNWQLCEQNAPSFIDSNSKSTANLSLAYALIGSSGGVSRSFCADWNI